MMDRRRMFLVGWDSFFMTAFCKVFTVPVYKGKPSGQIRKDHVYYYLPKSHTRSPAVLASVIKPVRTVW